MIYLLETKSKYTNFDHIHAQNECHNGQIDNMAIMAVVEWPILMHAKIGNQQWQDLVFIVKLQFRKPPLQKLCFSFQRLSYVGVHLPLNIVFHQRSSSIKGCLSSKGVFCHRSSSDLGLNPSLLGTWFIDPNPSDKCGKSEIFFAHIQLIKTHILHNLSSHVILL